MRLRVSLVRIATSGKVPLISGALYIPFGRSTDTTYLIGSDPFTLVRSIDRLVDRIASALDQQWVRRVNDLRILIVVVELVKEEAHRVDPSAFLVIALYCSPPRVVGVGGQQHGL